METLSSDKLVSFTKELYAQIVEQIGEPKFPLKQVYVGGMNYNREQEVWGTCDQLLGKSTITFDTSLLEERVNFIVDIVIHELAHVFAGNDAGHGVAFCKYESYIRKILFKKYCVISF